MRPSSLLLRSFHARLLAPLAASLVAARALAFAPPAEAPRFGPDQLRADFTIARHAFEEAHPGLYRFTPKPEMDRVFVAAERRLDRPMSAREFYGVLAPVVASIHCGHSRVEIPDTLVRELNSTRRLLPMQVRVLDGRVWVYRDLATDDERYAGRELVAVNGQPAARVLATLLAAMPRDGFGETMGPQSLRGFRFAGMLERIYGFDGSYDVELRDPASGRLERARLAGATVPAMTERLRSRHPGDLAPARNGEFELLDGGRIARLRLRGFFGTVDDSQKVDVRTFFRQSFESMRDHGTSSLILDLRDNGGGEDALGRILLSYLADRPFRYYEDLVINQRGFSFARYMTEFDSIPANLVERRSDGKYHAVGHPNWGLQQPVEPHFAGRVFVLMNGASFSTTCEFLSHVRDLGRATFIGEESGGAYVGNTSGGVAHVILPNTHVQIGVPIMRYDLAVAPAKPFGRGILPDVPVHYTIGDLLAGTDKDLAKALELAR